MTQVISSVWYRIANCKLSMVAHHDSLKLCSDHELRGTLGEDVRDRVLEQTTDALSAPEDYGRGDNLGLEDLFTEMSEEGLGQRTQTQEMDSCD